jgi:hypothetical protein
MLQAVNVQVDFLAFSLLMDALSSDKFEVHGAGVHAPQQAHGRLHGRLHGWLHGRLHGRVRRQHLGTCRRHLPGVLSGTAAGLLGISKPSA